MAVTDEREAQERERLGDGELLEGGEVGLFANFKVVGADRREALAGVGKLEGVIGIVREGDDEPAEGGVETFHAAEAPALLLAVGAGREREERFDLRDGVGQRCGGVIKRGDGEDGFEAGVGLVDGGVGLGQFGAEVFFFRAGGGAELEGVEPFVELAGSLEVRGDEGGQFGGGARVAGVGELLDEGQEEIGLVGEGICVNSS